MAKSKWRACLIAICLLLLSAAGFAAIRPSDPLFKENAEVDYLIVSAGDSAILAQARRLATFKWEKGLKTRVVSSDSICNAVDGQDDAQRIRNFLRAAYRDWGITWLLIFGDPKILPMRSAYSPHFRNDTTSTDLYYACLDGMWNPDKDSLYGEEPHTAQYDVACRVNSEGEYVCDSLYPVQLGFDMVPDVYIGRLPVADGLQARTIVDKTIQYIYSKGLGPYEQSMLLLAHSLSDWDYPVTDHETRTFEEIYRYHTSDRSAYRHFEIQRLYEDTVLASGTVFADRIPRDLAEYSQYLNRGYNVVYWTGHGGPTTIEIRSIEPRQYFRIEHVEALRSNTYSNLLTHSCSLMRTERDSCFAKSFLFNPHGGAISFSGMSNDGGYTTHYKMVAELLATRGVTRISRANQLANAALQYNRHKFMHQYWGDPEMQVSLRQPSGPREFRVVTFKSERWLTIQVSPVADSVLVCLYKDGELFKRSYTSNGMVEYNCLLSDVAGATVTASRFGYAPGRIVLNSDGLASARSPIAGTALKGNLKVRNEGTKIRFSWDHHSDPAQLTVFDVLGRQVVGWQANSQEGEILWHTGCTARAPMFVTLRFDGKMLVRKFVAGSAMR